jgi:hypothetical protein
MLTLRALFETRDHCEQSMLSSVAQQLQPWLDGVQAQTLSYDPVAAARCVERVPLLCDFWEAEEPMDAFEMVCEDVFEGSVGEGGGCRSDVECTGSAACEWSSGSCGVCRPRAPAGSTCEWRQMCSGAGADAVRCFEGSCVSLTLGSTRAMLNEPCGIIEPLGDANVVVVCAEGLWCDAEPSSPLGTCREPIAANAGCSDENDVCEDGSLCIESAGSCTPITIVDTAGGDCAANDFLFCAVDLFCDQGTCQPLGDGSAGSRCTEFSCNVGLFCDESTAVATCATLKADQESCGFNGECASAVCDQAGQCVALFCPG